MTIFSLLLAACNDTPSGCDHDSAAETPAMDCAGWCEEYDACTEQTYGVDACVQMCDVDPREADEWTACLAGGYESWDVAEYGWDRDACEGIAVECGQAPGA